MSNALPLLRAVRATHADIIARLDEAIEREGK